MTCSIPNARSSDGMELWDGLPRFGAIVSWEGQFAFLFVREEARRADLTFSQSNRWGILDWNGNKKFDFRPRTSC